MKQTILSLLLALLPLVASAVVVEIDGVRYNAAPGAKVATVSRQSKECAGDVVIHGSIVVEGVECAVTIIGDWAFQGCTDITSVTISEGVTKISRYAFAWCTGLKIVTIPSSVKEIMYDAFDGCKGLISINITDLAAWCGLNFSYISYNPLYYAKHLLLNGSEVEDLVIPDNVTTIGNSCFCNCSSLKSVTIPSSVTTIGKYAFSGCSELSSLTIPSSVTSIGESAFSNCSNLNTLTIPSSVTTLGDYAFSGCSELTSLTIPSSLTTIGGGTFNRCSSLKTITIPSSVTTLGDYAFNSCINITDVHCYAKQVPSTGKETFSNIPLKAATLHVPGKSFESYRTTSPWSEFGTIVSFGDTTLMIGNASVDEVRQQYISMKQEIELFFENYNKRHSLEVNNQYCFNDIRKGVESDLDNFMRNLDAYEAGDTTLSGMLLNQWVNLRDYLNQLGTIEYYTSDVTITAYGGGSVEVGSTSISNGTKRFSWLYPKVESSSLAHGKFEYIFGDLEVYPDSGYHVAYIMQNGQVLSSTDAYGEIVVTFEADLQCAKPTIDYKDGRLIFTCDTEGADFKYEITDVDITSGSGSMADLCVNYSIKVRATKENYRDSEEATANICWRNGRLLFEGFDTIDLGGHNPHNETIGDVNGDGKVDATDLTRLIDILLGR